MALRRGHLECGASCLTSRSSQQLAVPYLFLVRPNSMGGLMEIMARDEKYDVRDQSQG
jgi:hypothetical protein